MLCFLTDVRQEAKVPRDYPRFVFLHEGSGAGRQTQRTLGQNLPGGLEQSQKRWPCSWQGANQMILRPLPAQTILWFMINIILLS